MGCKAVILRDAASASHAAGLFNNKNGQDVRQSHCVHLVGVCQVMCWAEYAALPSRLRIKRALTLPAHAPAGNCGDI
jgi:hypothetical protein